MSGRIEKDERLSVELSLRQAKNGKLRNACFHRRDTEKPSEQQPNHAKVLLPGIGSCRISNSYEVRLLN
jgi:hypothetical protein